MLVTKRKYYTVGMITVLIGFCCICAYNIKFLRGYIAPLACGHSLWVRESDVIGTWQTTYGSIDGGFTEQITLNANYTYVQVFENGLENRSTWQLIKGEPYSPKILLNYGWFYYTTTDYTVGEAELGTITKSKQLTPQVIDIVEHGSEIVINYPKDGYIYMYPRICQGKFALQGMVDHDVDLDSRASIGAMYFLIE